MSEGQLALDLLRRIAEALEKQLAANLDLAEKMRAMLDSMPTNPCEQEQP